jgi:hypothetical protein
MRKVRGLVAPGLLLLATGCVQSYGYPGGYPTTAYGGYPGSYYGSNYGYYSQPSYYQSSPVYYQSRPTYYQPVQTRYVPVPTYSSRSWSQRSSWGRRDSDGDGIPNRYDRDRNNDGIPDRRQRRGWGWSG